MEKFCTQATVWTNSSSIHYWQCSPCQAYTFFRGMS